MAGSLHGLALELGVAPDLVDTVICFERAQQLGGKAEGSSGTSVVLVP